MSITQVYNVEIFSPDITYRDSAQVSELTYKYDYLDIEKNKIKLPRINATKGDYIRILGHKMELIGIVSDVTRKDKEYTIEYKTFNKILDVEMYMPQASGCIEEYLSGLICGQWVENEDNFQNIKGLEVMANTRTEGALDVDEGINNLFDVVAEAFEIHQIVLDWHLDVAARKVKCSIHKIEPGTFTIEADLENVLEKTITLKESCEASESVNKVIIYNEENYRQHAIYYRQQDDTVTQNPVSRKLPVVTRAAICRATDKTSFEDAAMARATAILKPDKYDNLIEITVAPDDLLVMPELRYVGQEARIISGGNIYCTVLTGKEIKGGTVKLIFGAIRLELTKRIKRKWRKWNVN